MNTVKAQYEYLKRLINGEQVVFCSGKDECIGLSDSKAVYFIPEKQMYLKQSDGDMCDAKFILKPFSDSRLVEQTERIAKTKDGEAVEFSDGENVSVWVLKKYLFCFDKYDRFYAIDRRHPLFVTDESMDVQAIVLPYIVKENEEIKGN